MGRRKRDLRQLVTGSTIVTRPLYSSRTEWAWLVGNDWRNERVRRYVDTTVALFNARVTPEADALRDEYHAGRTILRLDSIDAERAVVVSHSTATTQAGVPTSSETTGTHRAKIRPEATSPSRPDETGDETLEISGRKFATHWEKTYGHLPGSNARDPNTYTQTWFSPEVPGGQVLVRRQSHNEILGKTYRRYALTIIEPVAGIEPEFGPLKADAKKSALLVSTASMDDIRKRYTALGEQDIATRNRLYEWQMAHRATRPPAAVENFVPNLIYEGRKVYPAIQANNRAAAETAMKAVEDKLDEIDRFLNTGQLPAEPTAAAPSNAPAAPMVKMTFAEYSRANQQYVALMTRASRAKAATSSGLSATGQFSSRSRWIPPGGNQDIPVQASRGEAGQPS